MGKVLILSNKTDLSNQLKLDVQNRDNSVIVAKFQDVTQVIHTKNPDLIIADLTLQGSIIEVWRRLVIDMEEARKPTMVLVSKERLTELEMLEGVNDFISYPYDARELETRIKIILSRYKTTNSEELIKIGNLVIDPTKYEVTVNGWSVVLTLKEYELLKYLATHRGRVFTREILLDQIWGYDYYGGTRTVDVHIGRLRTKVETGGYSFIKTVRGVGYTFTENFYN